MSHIDEGELTAFADGAYAPDSAEARAFTAHLATCENCRNRLADAQQLSARAGEVLSYASPVNVTVPPFETLDAPRTKRGFAIPLTWAASIILAIGLGWYAHGGVQPSPQLAEAPTRTRRATTTPVVSTKPAVD